MSASFSVANLAPSRRQLGKIALAATGLTLAGASAASAASSDIRAVSTAYRNQDAQKLLNLINAYRAENGLSAVKHSATIASVMDAEARRQFNAGYFSHGTEFIYNSKVQGYSFVREVIALSYNDDISQLLAFWKSSAPHRAAILAPEANTIGIGLCYGYGTNLPWRVLGNVGIYRYVGNNGPGDIQATVAGGNTGSGASTNLNYPVVNGIASRFYADGGLNYYGQPTMSEQGGLANGGAWQAFKRDNLSYSILWSPNTGAYGVYENGAIAAHWRANGAENGFGYPIMNERGGLVNGGAWQQFRAANGRPHTILWSPATGAHTILENGGISHVWRSNGAESGFGYPTTNEYWSGIEVRQQFSNGRTIAWNSITEGTRII